MEWLVRTDTFSPLFFPNFYFLSVFSNCWFSSPPSVCLSAPVCVRLPCLLFFFFVRPPVLRELFWVFSCWFSAPLYVFPVSSFSCFWVSPLLLVLFFRRSSFLVPPHFVAFSGFYKARGWPLFMCSCLTIVRHERLCFFEKKQGKLQDCSTWPLEDNEQPRRRSCETWSQTVLVSC